MIRVYVLVTCLFGLCSSYGQSLKEPMTVNSLVKVQAGAQGIGLSFEPGIGSKLTIDLAAGVGGGYSIAEGTIDYDLLKPALYFSATPRFFYNLSKRKAAGRNTGFNAGNYFGASVKYVVPFRRSDDKVRRAAMANIHWGIQRAIGGRFVFNSHVGVGYANDIPTKFGTVYPAIDFRFSYVL